MSFEFTTTSEGRYRLAGELCIFNAAELKEQLLGVLGDEVKCALDLSQVTEIDTAGIQLLLLAKQEATRLGGSLDLFDHSESMREAISLLNVANALDVPSLIPAQSVLEAHHVQ